MPTQSLPRQQIVARYGELINGFESPPADHPLAAGLPGGSVTDDTEQALLVAQVLIDGHGRIDPAVLADRLIAWESSMRARGSSDLLGPSTARALQELSAGVEPSETGRFGTTNGAAMRVTPVGIVATSSDLPRLVDRVVDSCSVTHNTGLGLAGAAAVAAAVSAGLDGADPSGAIALAITAASEAARRGHWVAGADVAARIRWAVELVRGRAVADVIDIVYRLVGTSLASQESVPAAFAVFAAFADDPWLVCRVGASVGGDCDTIAAMAGAMAGAQHGTRGFPAQARELVDTVNDLHLADTAAALCALRVGP